MQEARRQHEPTVEGWVKAMTTDDFDGYVNEESAYCMREF